MNMHMIHEYNWFWSQSKSVNDSIKKSCWLNVKCKMTDYSITIILLFWTLNLYNLKFLNLLMMLWLLNIQIMWKLMKLYNKFITNLWCMILWEDMYNSIWYVLKKKLDMWKSKMYYDFCLFQCDNDEISQLTLLSIYWIAMTIQT